MEQDRVTQGDSAVFGLKMPDFLKVLQHLDNYPV
jgi:hypothetical protein